jgi:hypothetical protein
MWIGAPVGFCRTLGAALPRARSETRGHDTAAPTPRGECHQSVCLIASRRGLRNVTGPRVSAEWVPVQPERQSHGSAQIFDLTMQEC